MIYIISFSNTILAITLTTTISTQIKIKEVWEISIQDKADEILPAALTIPAVKSNRSPSRKRSMAGLRGSEKIIQLQSKYVIFYD